MTNFVGPRKWWNRIRYPLRRVQIRRTVEPERPVLTASVIAEPNRAGTYSFVVLLADDTLKSTTGYTTEQAAKSAGVEWVKRIGHKVGSTGRTAISLGG